MCEHPKPHFAIGQDVIYCGFCGAIKKRVDPEWRIPTLRLAKTRKQPTYLPDIEFEEFWKVYPKKDAKQAALKAWVKNNPKRPSIDVILKAVKAYTLMKKGSMIANPATWLNGGQWEDESIKKFMFQEKLEHVDILTPKEKMLQELKARRAAMLDIGTEKSLRLADEILSEIQILEGA